MLAIEAPVRVQVPDLSRNERPSSLQRRPAAPRQPSVGRFLYQSLELHLQVRYGCSGCSEITRIGVGDVTHSIGGNEERGAIKGGGKHGIDNN